VIDVLQFIFSSFWIWLGCLFLIAAIGGSVAEVIQAVRK
jgi:hypothetical protein